MDEQKLNDILNKIMKYNDYPKGCMTVKACNKKNLWTPVDLICREYYNNGCGSAEGFLGITPSTCEAAFNYIKEHNDYYRDNGMLSKNGVNNCGFPLWFNYKLN